MNRLHHLRETLPKNVANNLNYPNLEFVILDYNSSDGLEQWIKSEMLTYIETGLLIFIRTNEPAHFNRSHSRNIAFRMATGDIVCNVDADNFTGKGFANFIARTFAKNRDIYLVADNKGRYYYKPDVVGRFCALKKDFLSIRGYDESLVNYGFEDTDLFNRFERLGVKEVVIRNHEYLNALTHSNEERLREESLLKNLCEVHLSYVNEAKSIALLLFHDGTYRKQQLFALASFLSLSITNVLMDASSYAKQHDELVDKLMFIWQEGKWERTDNGNYRFSGPENEIVVLPVKENTFAWIENNTSTLFYRIISHELIMRIVLYHSMALNYDRFRLNKQKELQEVNDDGFGKGVVYKNFNDAAIFLE